MENIDIPQKCLEPNGESEFKDCPTSVCDMLAFYTVTIYLQNYEAFRCDGEQCDATNEARSGNSHGLLIPKGKEHMSNRLL